MKIFENSNAKSLEENLLVFVFQIAKKMLREKKAATTKEANKSAPEDDEQIIEQHKIKRF